MQNESWNRWGSYSIPSSGNLIKRKKVLMNREVDSTHAPLIKLGEETVERFSISHLISNIEIARLNVSMKLCMNIDYMRVVLYHHSYRLKRSSQWRELLSKRLTVHLESSFILYVCFLLAIWCAWWTHFIEKASSFL